MVEVELRGVTSQPRDGRHAVEDVSLRVADGEVMALLGPSGCGKTTLLRLVAGLEPVFAGEVLLGGEVANDVPTEHRELAMVTEENALLEHLDVEGNLAFGLRVRRLLPAEIARRVRAEARVFSLTRLLRRRPRTLSAGEQQAASIARATVRVPAAYLFDEPLTRIDARERERLRAELSRYVRGLGVTALLATNDQRDALALADRVVLLRDGRLQQAGTHAELYGRPANVFVARFVGDPGMNIVAGVLECGARSTRLRAGGASLPLAGVPQRTRARFDGAPVLLGIRPEGVALHAPGSPDTLPAVVARVEHLGAEARVVARLDVPASEVVALLRPPVDVPETGQAVGLGGRSAAHLFDPASEEALWHGTAAPGATG